MKIKMAYWQTDHQNLKMPLEVCRSISKRGGGRCSRDEGDWRGKYENYMKNIYSGGGIYILYA